MGGGRNRLNHKTPVPSYSLRAFGYSQMVGGYYLTDPKELEKKTLARAVLHININFASPPDHQHEGIRWL